MVAGCSTLKYDNNNIATGLGIKEGTKGKVYLGWKGKIIGSVIDRNMSIFWEAFLKPDANGRRGIVVNGPNAPATKSRRRDRQDSRSAAEIQDPVVRKRSDPVKKPQAGARGSVLPRPETHARLKGEDDLARLRSISPPRRPHHEPR